jgi:thioredoxin 1
MIEFTDINFRSEVVESEIPVLVDFWAPWCAPCRTMLTVVEQIAQKFAGRVKVGKLNIDDNPDIGELYFIRSIPTLMIMKDGAPVAYTVGVVPESKIEDMINGALNS